MAEIDSLDIKISAEADRANATLETLVKKLDKVSASLSGVNSRGLATMGAGVNKLSNAMNNFANNTKTADFSRLSRNLGTISDIDTGKFSDLSSKMSQLSSAFNSFGKVPEAAQQIGEFAKNIAKLGNKSVQTAIDNIPKLAVAMKDLMQTLSDAPKVSQNLIDMTNALANFTQQGSKVRVVSGTLESGLNRSSKAMNNAKKSSTSLAAAFGKFYATYFLLIRGTKKLWGSIESSFDYLEVLNYFDAAFGQVAANADLSSFEDMGYSSAEAYYGSFAKRAEELTQKMSGFTIGEGGLLESTGAVSLGLDPSQLMNYQAMFGQMSSSMGVTSETALKLSQALTEIGADLASVKNLDFESVWNDMASGLAGMSRTLDKYGVNIRNVNLQQKLNEIGINANIQALNQNDKALLRAIILLENTKYAWGDLADTINQPANQLRLIQANFENLSRTIGNLFLPIAKTVLPYVNALVIAVQRLFSWLGNLIGIDISDISTSIGGADMGDILDQTDDLSSGLGDAKKQADKLNKSLRQFDELKVISTKQDDGGGGGGGAGLQGGLLDEAFNKAFSDYQKVWDEAFGNLENRAQEIADKIEKAFEPLKKIIQDFAIGDFFQAGKDTSALVVGIFDFFADAIDRVDWYGIGKKIGDFLAGIDWLEILKSVGNLIWQALKAAFELYVGAFSSAPLETALVSLVAFPKLLKAITASKFITGIGKLWKNFKVWGDKIHLVSGLLMGNKDSVSDLYSLYPKLGKKVDGVKTAFSKFFSSVKTNGFWKTVDGGITNIRNNLGGLQKAAIVAVAGFAEFSVVSDSVEKLTLGTENWLAEIGKIAGVVAAAGAAMYVALGPAGLAIAAITGVVAAIVGVNEAFDKMTEQFVNSVVFDNAGTSISKIADNVSNLINITGTSADTMQKFADDIANIQNSIDRANDSIDGYRLTLEKTGTLSEEEIGGMKTSVQELATALDKELKYNTDIAFTTFKNLSGETAEKLGVDVETMTGILSQFQNRFSGIYGDIQSEADDLMDKMLAGTATEDDISSLYSLLDELEYLSGDAIKRQVELQNSMAEMLKIDFGNVEETTAAIQSIKETGLEKMSELDSYYEDLTSQVSVWQEEVRRALEIGRITEDEANSYYDWLGALSTTYDENWSAEKTEIENQINTTYDYIKSQLELKGTEVYEAAENYNQGFWESVFNPHKDTKAVNKFTEDIYNPIIQSINDAKKEINPVAESVGTEMWDNFSSWVKEADNSTLGLYDIAMQELNGYKKGIEDNSDIAISAMQELFGDGIADGLITKESKEGVGVHSPSTVFEEIGLNTVLGFNKGITQNKGLTISTISSYMEEIKSIFSNVFGVFEEIGKMAMQGFESGISQMEGGLYDKANSIADNITQTIKSALEIHSPSRVMFRLGDFTMQGFKEGMENLYNPITDSIKAFSYDVAVAPAPLTDIYSGYHYDASQYMQSGYSGGDSNFFGMSETALYNLFYNATEAAINNSKLMNDQKDMVKAILKKPTMEIGDLNHALAKDSMDRGGNIHGGSMSRLAVAEEVYY